MKQRLTLALFLIGLGLALPACSLAGDVTPPPQAQTFNSSNTTAAPPPTAEPASPAAALPTDSGSRFPLARPSATDGAAVYAEHCAACHGSSGKGDGTMAARLPAPPPDFSNPETLAGLTPLDLFTTITAGRQDKFMPPFNNLLTETERWNAAAYLLALSTPQVQVEAGRVVYAAQCASCHGETGAGDGPNAAGQLPSFTDQQFMAGESQAALLDFVTQGKPPAMPGYADTLSAADIQAAAAYARSLSYDFSAPAAAAEQIGVVRGKVANGTAGAPLPASLEINLHSFDDVNSVTTITATVGADGAFQFDNVPYTAQRQFLITTSYEAVVYGSPAATFSSGQSALDLPVTIYETTTDAAAVRIQQMHVFFEFAPGSVTVGEIYIFANTGDRTLWNAGGSLEFPIPAGATDLQVPQRTENTDWTRTNFGLRILAPVIPGEQTSQVIITFGLPYTDQLAFEQPLLYPADSANVLLPQVGVKLTGAFTSEGTQSIQGTPYELFSASNLAANSAVKFQLSGKPGSGAAAAGGDNNTLGLIVGIGALAAALAGIGYWLYERRQAPDRADEPLSREALLDALAALDDQFENDGIEEHEYERRRARLKAQLARRMKAE